MDVSNAIYESNWLSLSSKMRKKLIIMMIRATRPIQFSVGFFIMNAASFIEVRTIFIFTYLYLE